MTTAFAKPADHYGGSLALEIVLRRHGFFTETGFAIRPEQALAILECPLVKIESDVTVSSLFSAIDGMPELRILLARILPSDRDVWSRREIDDSGIEQVVVSWQNSGISNGHDLYCDWLGAHGKAGDERFALAGLLLQQIQHATLSLDTRFQIRRNADSTTIVSAQRFPDVLSFLLALRRDQLWGYISPLSFPSDS